jgi:peptidoglycan hydrolase CwlO-like protein
MKKSLITALVVGVTTFSSPTPINTINTNSKNQTKTVVIQKTGLELFLHSLGEYESNNDYTKVNKWGYLGKYQFSKRTLRGLGYKVKPEVFLNNPQNYKNKLYEIYLLIISV